MSNVKDKSSNNKYKKKASPKKSSKSKPKRDQNFWDEFHTASDIFFNECLIDQDTADNIKVRVKHELSYSGHNIWFNIGNDKNKDKIDIGKETDNNFKRSIFFKNKKFQEKLIDFYLKHLPEVDLKFIGPTFKTGDLLLKLVPYSEN